MSSGHGKMPLPGEGLVKFLDGYGINTAYILAGLGLVIAFSVASVMGIPASRWVGYIVFTSPLWLPYLLFHKILHLWMEYIQLDYDLKQGRVTLEIQFPQEVNKSPLAMELVFGQLYQTATPDNLIETYWDGKHPPVFGLEIVSDGGRIHFYISTPVKKYKNLVEAQMYAQYPGIIVTELAVDYTAAVPWDPDKFGIFVLHYRLKKPNPYPIKTYIDYGLDKDPKEEYKIDPITPMLELLGSLGPKEKLWIQILFSAHRKEEFANGSLHTHADWQDEITAEINKLAQRDDKKQGTVEFESAPRVTPGERDIISAIERHSGKLAFNVKIRTVNIGIDEGAKMLGERIGPTITIWRAFEDLKRNGIGAGWRTDFDYNWWQDRSGARRNALKKMELGMYKTRSYLQQGGADGGFILTTEELATIFHPAGKVILTPSLERIPSARSEAPANLPTATVQHDRH